MLRQCIAGKAPRKTGEVLEVSTDEGKILIAAGDAAEHKQAVKGRPKKDGTRISHRSEWVFLHR